MKYIFVTGGVISGLGKGISASSIAVLLKNAGYKVTQIKMDPYLQIDAGTMSPYEHGEVFVTKDGGETDLDLGHYERFIDENLTSANSITTGKIYQSVINKERQGEYLGQTVQVIPHVTNEIKDQLKIASEGYEIAVVEIGGTVGDIEGPHFLETLRQMRSEGGKSNVAFVHLAPLLYASHLGEAKTKAIQHSVIKLREAGLTADFLICRTTVELTPSHKKKLALFCDLPQQNIIEGRDVQSIYEVPLSYAEQNFSDLLQQQLFGETRPTDMRDWEKFVIKLTNPSKKVTIGIAGKYVQLDDCYLSVIEACKHAAVHNDASVEIVWIDTEQLEKNNRSDELTTIIHQKKVDGLLVPGGFGNRGVEGMINVARYAREHQIPYLGICLGLQVAVIATARDAGIPEATSMEFENHPSEPVITLMDEQKNITAKGGTMRLGDYPALLTPESKVAQLYQQTEIIERHRHRYEVNPAYHEILKKAGLLLSGMSPDRLLVEHIEDNSHPYFIATQAHPEFLSRPSKPHPLFDGLIRASL